MQPWTLATPAMLGQFPAAALLYRRGLVAPGAVVAEVRLNTSDLAQLILTYEAISTFSIGRTSSTSP